MAVMNTNTLPITALYVRASATQQDTETQEAYLKQSTRGQKVVLYRDRSSSGTIDRPGWKKLISAVHAGQVKSIVVSQLDRLGRTTKELTALLSELRERNVNLISVNDSFDLNTPTGHLISNVLGSVTQYEAEVRAERVKSGQEAARAKGKRWGGSSKGRRLYVTADQVAKIRKMKAQKATVASIARATGLSRQTVYRYVR